MAETPDSTDRGAFQGMTVLGCRLDSQLGRGSSGAVYRAHQLRLERDVAVKLMPSDEAAPGTAARFRREVRAVATLNHPHVVPLFDAGEDEGLLILVMGLVDGDDLHRMVQRDGPLPPDRAVEIVAQVGSALDAAHTAGVVHRDVKPANILLTRAGAAGTGTAGTTATGTGTAYLTDFGLARDLATSGDSTVTGEGRWVGTPAYAAPEQLRGERVGPSADLYALAGVLHYLLTGRHPTDGTGGRELSGVLAVAASGMTLRTEDRFPSAAALVDAARAAPTPTGPDPPVPAPVSTLETTDGPVSARRRSRSRTVMILAGVVVAATVLAVAGFVGLSEGLPWASEGSRGTATAPASSPRPSSETSDETSPAEAGEPWPMLAPGDTGTLVAVAQYLLADRRSDLPADGVYGAQTRAAVRAFQAEQGLDETGRLDSGTWTRLTPRLSRGDVARSVRAVQVLLRADDDGIEVDGRFGQQTQRSVAGFQADRGLDVDGIVGPETWQALVSQ